MKVFCTYSVDSQAQFFFMWQEYCFLGRKYFLNNDSLMLNTLVSSIKIVKKWLKRKLIVTALGSLVINHYIAQTPCIPKLDAG
jgi:hypothetical protein